MSTEVRKKPKPQGIVRIFMDETGRVIANVSDFDSSGYGGFSKQQAQEMRTRKALSRAVVQEYASPQLTRAIGEYDCQTILDRLEREFNCSVKTIAIGYDTEAE